MTALWSGLGVVRALQSAFNSVWEIPYHRRPGMVKQIVRSLLQELSAFIISRHLKSAQSTYGHFAQ